MSAIPSHAVFDLVHRQHLSANKIPKMNELFCPDWAECNDQGCDPLTEGSQFLDEFEYLKSQAEETGV